ncbi:transposase [Verrucomicrobiaceae bacterium R5-34]|nr:transposase [Verrucomicrobiaceae bacterium R5-34]
MARGNRLDKIVRSDADREVFEATLEEVVGRTGWRVYAYALIDNHYHLVFKTPKANLVEGMTWFQNTVTKRHNARNKLRGHLFSGRYKAVLVEENDYLDTLIHYVHLNPVRAKLVAVKDGIENYPWCSLADYIKPASKRRSWIAVGAGLEHLGYADTAAGRRKFLADTEGLVDKSRLTRAGIDQPEGAGLQVTVERGWCFGSEEFREKMSLLVGAAKGDTGTAGSKANGYSGNQTNDHAEATARLWIERGLEVVGLSREELATTNKTDWRKAMIVRSIRKHSSVKLDWIAKELHMGVRSGVTRAEQMLKVKLANKKQVQRMWRKIEEMHHFYACPLILLI